MFVGCAICLREGAKGLLAGDAQRWYKHVLRTVAIVVARKPVGHDQRLQKWTMVRQADRPGGQ